VSTTEKQPTAIRTAADLYADYRRYVAKIGGNILHGHADVDDLVQDVFLATHQELHQLRDAACTKAWLATITVRLAQRLVRQRSLQRRIGAIEPYELSVMSSIAIASDAQADLTGTAARFQKLPRRLRAAWLLKYVDGESLPTIAARCNCSASTAQRRIRGATRRMRQNAPGARAVPTG
jgi:RNA polymerase sigma factor (sigma-70 family)